MHREAIRKWLTRSRQVNRCNCIAAMDQTQAINFEVKKVGTAIMIPLSGTWPRPRLLRGCQWDYEPEAFPLRYAFPATMGSRVSFQMPLAVGPSQPGPAWQGSSGSVHRDPPPPGTGPRPGPQPGRTLLGNSLLKPEPEARRLPRPILATAPNN